MDEFRYNKNINIVIPAEATSAWQTFPGPEDIVTVELLEQKKQRTAYPQLLKFSLTMAVSSMQDLKVESHAPTIWKDLLLPELHSLIPLLQPENESHIRVPYQHNNETLYQIYKQIKLWKTILNNTHNVLFHSCGVIIYVWISEVTVEKIHADWRKKEAISCVSVITLRNFLPKTSSI